MATFADPAGDPRLVEIGALQVDQHHDHLIAHKALARAMKSILEGWE
jgi:hypothetical protein